MSDPSVVEIRRLLDIMTRLRAPADGCPWDREQTFASIAPYTIEEAYEVAEAAAQGDMAALKEELGDLLFQVVFHAQMAEEAAEFSFAEVAGAVADKMVRRHPHVFAAGRIADAQAQTRAWEDHKAAERAAKAAKIDPLPGAAKAGVLDGVSLALPALMRAVKLQNRAARVGFDWPDIAPVFAKLDEELAELRAEMADGAAPARLEEELGDVLFVVANLARHLKIDPEQALRLANGKFTRRFKWIEEALAAMGKAPEQSTLTEMDRLWDRAKEQEKIP